jgi:hypothetical protein
MQSRAISPEQWRELLKAATAFRQLAPWQWMTDDMLFGVQDPATGTIGYCCILGALGQVLALNVYLGREGLESYREIYRQKQQNAPREAMFVQRVLMASYEDREDLEKRDLDPLRALGLTFRGRQEWPQFRDYSPGLFPWFIDEAQALFLTHALHQACEVARRVKVNPDLLLSDDEDRLLVRVPHTSPEGLSWADSWMAPQPLSTSASIVPMPTKRDFKGLRGKSIGHAVWEAEFWHVATTIQEKPSERPYFPKMLMGVEKTGGIVVMQHLFRRDIPLSAVQSEVLRSLARLPELPREIHVRRDELLNILGPIGQAAGVRVLKRRSLPALDHAWNDLDRYMTSQRRDRS